MAFGQAAEQQQPQEQTKEPVKETETTAPAKGQNIQHPAKAQSTPTTKAETGKDVHGQTNVQPGHTEETRKNEAAGARSGASQTNVKGGTQTKVNVEEFKSRHSEVFNLGRHPKEFFIQRFGENHVRVIGGGYFVFVDNCWVAVDVDGYGYSERVICAGDPEFVEVY
jgi:cytoskeletal protein RodZ